MRIVIIEDYPPVARSLARQVNEILSETAITLHMFRKLDEAQAYLSRHPVDLVLLDLNLNGENGFKLLRQSVAGSFYTIVVSANTDRALEAFEYGVLDFIPKPVREERLRKAFSRLLGNQERAHPALKYLAVKKGDRIDLIELDRIQYIKGAGKYAELFLCDGTTALHDKSLENLQILLPDAFFRIHKSYLVDLARIKSLAVHGGGRYEIHLHCGKQLPVGRSRYRPLKALLT